MKQFMIPAVYQIIKREENNTDSVYLLHLGLGYNLYPLLIYR
ncbi:hypothetical protein RINTHM_14860 [Richelia intracellularis HM01]|nr:hypothetical protein RINTHM_14860 [Richelia intracellularis HM01]